jgi:tetratricopeptide (TPR) repeat protein
MKVGGWAIMMFVALAPLARAGGVDDANSGLAALNRADYDGAILLFTRAINSGELEAADRENGLACRGHAYLKVGRYSQAIADLDEARRLRPDDADAQNDLVIAIGSEIPVSAIPGAPRDLAAGPPQPAKPSFWTSLGRAIMSGAKAGIQEGLDNAAQGPGTPN